jgi:hypothetical protein
MSFLPLYYEAPMVWSFDNFRHLTVSLSWKLYIIGHRLDNIFDLFFNKESRRGEVVREFSFTLYISKKVLSPQLSISETTSKCHIYVYSNLLLRYWKGLPVCDRSMQLSLLCRLQIMLRVYHVSRTDRVQLTLERILHLHVSETIFTLRCYVPLYTNPRAGPRLRSDWIHVKCGSVAAV